MSITEGWLTQYHRQHATVLPPCSAWQPDNSIDLRGQAALRVSSRKLQDSKRSVSIRVHERRGQRCPFLAALLQ